MSRKSRSARRSRETPGTEAASGAPRRHRAFATLPRELADFLVEFSIVLHQGSMYPAGHPHLQDSADRFMRRMNLLLESRESVTLAVARHRLVIENLTTDPSNALLRELAQRLHRHRIAAVRLSRGATLDQVDGLLTALSGDPKRGDGPVGKRLDQVGPWSHIRLRPAGYAGFELRSSGTDASSDPGEPLTAKDSWVELAQLALASDQATPAGTADPVVVAEAIGRRSGEVAYERVVLGYLARVAEEVSRSGVSGAPDQLAQRISKLIRALNPDTLQRLLEANADRAERRKFVLNAAQILAADAVLGVVEAAAKVSHQSISHNLLRLLHKLAHHAEEGPQDIRAQADGALRTNIARMIADWELEDPNPTLYNAILERMARRTSAGHSMVELQVGCDPDVLVKMALELECLGPAVYAAVEELLAKRELVRLAHLLQTATRSAASDQLWRYLATPERLDQELAATPLDQEAVAILVDHIGSVAADSLLDRLTSAADRSTRAAILRQLLALGPAVAQTAVDRLPGAPWFVQRNILVLLGRLGSWPSDFSPTAYAASPDPRIRREAIKLMLDSKDQCLEGMRLGMQDAEEGIVVLALSAALEGCSPEVTPAIRRIAGDVRRSSQCRVLAIRALWRSRTPENLHALRDLALHRRRWLGRRLAPKSPELLAALAGLAVNWSDDPEAREIL